MTNNNKDDYVTSPALSYLQNLVRHEVFLNFPLEIYYCFATILVTSLWSGLVPKDEFLDPSKRNDFKKVHTAEFNIHTCISLISKIFHIVKK